MPGSPVTRGLAELKDVPLEIVSVGRAEALSTVSVKAQVGGEVTGVYFKEGQTVRKGDRLFTIDPRPFDIAVRQAESLLEKDRALLKNAEADVARYAGLVQKDYVTKEQYDALVANRDVLAPPSRPTRPGSRTPVSISTTRPSARRSTAGPGSCSSTPAISSRPTIRRRRRDRPDQPDLCHLFRPRAGSGPDQGVHGQGRRSRRRPLAAGEGQTPASGVLTFVDNAIDESTGTITLRATFDNPDRALWPGQFLNVRLTLTTETGRRRRPLPGRPDRPGRRICLCRQGRPDRRNETGQGRPGIRRRFRHLRRPEAGRTRRHGRAAPARPRGPRSRSSRAARRGGVMNFSESSSAAR